MSASAGWQNWSRGCSPGGAVTFAWGPGGGLPSSVSGTAAYLTGVSAGEAGPPAAPTFWAGPPAASTFWAGRPTVSAGWAGRPVASAGPAGLATAPLAARPELSRVTPALAVSTHRISAAMAKTAP